MCVLVAGACTPVSPTASGPTPSPTPAPPGQVAAPPSTPTALGRPQTPPPAAQSTVQAAATAEASVVASPEYQYISQILSSILGGGVQLDLQQEPLNVPNNQVTSVRLHAIDRSGAYAGLDREGRDKTAEAVLVAASQFYPQATIDLLIVDGSNRTLTTGSRAPGEPPKLDD